MSQYAQDFLRGFLICFLKEVGERNFINYQFEIRIDKKSQSVDNEQSSSKIENADNENQEEEKDEEMSNYSVPEEPEINQVPLSIELRQHNYN